MEAIDPLTLEQSMRDRWMEILLMRPNAGTVQTAMLMAEPIVNYVLKGEILGIDKIVDDKAGSNLPARRQSARTR